MLSGKQWRQLQDLGLELLDVRDGVEHVPATLAALLQVVPGAVAGEMEVEPRGRMQLQEMPDLLLTRVEPDLLDTVLTASPALPHLRRTGYLSATRVEDLIGPSTWSSHPMRTHLLDPHGVPHAVICAHTAEDGSVHGWGVNRETPFHDDEVAALEAFEPFLRRAVVHRQREALSRELDAAAARGLGLVVLRGGRVHQLNGEAERLLRTHGVLSNQLAQAALSRACEPAGWTTIRTARGGLRALRRSSTGGSVVVVLTQDPAQAPAAPPHLTPRQQLVLRYLAQGLTAAAIARHVGASERTVHKHLEHLYRRIGVRDRLEAVLRAHALGLLDDDVLVPSSDCAPRGQRPRAVQDAAPSSPHASAETAAGRLSSG